MQIIDISMKCQLACSPPTIVARARMILGSMVELINRTDPSAKTKLAPPGKLLPIPSGPLI